MERLSNEPHLVLLRRVPSGDKTFSRFQKRPLLEVYLESVKNGPKEQLKLSKKPKIRGFGWSFNGMRKVGV